MYTLRSNPSGMPSPSVSNRLEEMRNDRPIPSRGRERILWFFAAGRRTRTPSEVTLVCEHGEKRRAAAKCERCGAIGIVQVWPDGTLKPLGQSALCECEDGTLRVLETDPDEVA
jgi:hypothetical protein